MIYRSLLLIIAYFFFNNSNAQTITFAYGTSVSSLNWNAYNPLLKGYIYPTDKKLIGIYASVQLDYLNHTYWNILSSIGYYEKGAANKFLKKNGS